MTNEFPDNSKILFGREADIAYLLQRSQRLGVTAVMGQPQMGKSWLLLEVARRLSTGVWPDDTRGALSLRGLPPLVGRVESEGQYADMLPRAVQDLYRRWLAESTYWEQARAFFEQNKSDVIGNVGRTVGWLVKSVGGLHATPGDKLGDLVKETFDGLARANQDLKSGGMQMPSLQTDDSRELLRIVFAITGRSAVLIFDQWEKSPELGKEAKILDAFVHHIGDWPPCHIFLATRPDEEPRWRLEDLRAGYPGRVVLSNLAPMRLAENMPRERMLASLRERMPITRSIGDQDLLELVSGNPAVLDRWTNTDEGKEAGSRETLVALAVQANSYSYPEFARLLRERVLKGEERALAIRLILLPHASDVEGWKALRTVALSGCPGSVVDNLRNMGVLLSGSLGSPPDYGHAKRAEAALACYREHCSEELHDLSEALILSLARHVSDTEPRTLPYLSSLFAARSIVLHMNVSPLALALCEAAYSLFEAGTNSQRLVGISQEVTDPELLPLLAMGLFGALVDAKQDQKLELRDSLLQELRELAHMYPEDVAVRQYLASALSNSLVDAKQEKELERRDSLLEELRTLARQYPTDKVAREWMIKGLFNAVLDAEQEGASERRDTLFGELRELSKTYPDDPVARQWLAEGLYNTLTNGKQLESPLEELRELSRMHPNEPALRECLARSLFSTVVQANHSSVLEGRYALLDELRELSRKFPVDAIVREWLVKGLFNTLLETNRQKMLSRRDSLLFELREFVQSHLDDTFVQGVIGAALQISARAVA